MLTLTHPSKTKLHSIPAGWKLCALAIVTTTVFWASSAWVSGAMILAGLALSAMCGWDFFKTALTQILRLWPFVLVLALWHSFQDDLIQGLIIITRLVAAVVLANLVTMTTPLQSLLAVFKRILSPLWWIGINPNAVALAMAMMIRFIPVFVERLNVLRMAFRARSSKSAGWRIVLPLAISALDDADHLSDALRARGGIPEHKKV